jgi:hypothetical protein
MGRLTRHRLPAAAPAAVDLDAALASIEAMTMDDLRDLWRERRGGEPPAALSKDLIARVLTYRLQEEHLGGLDSWTRKRLDSSSPKKAVGPYRQVKCQSASNFDPRSASKNDPLVLHQRSALAGPGAGRGCGGPASAGYEGVGCIRLERGS